MPTPSSSHPCRSLMIVLLLVTTLLTSLMVIAPRVAASTFYVSGHLTSDQTWSAGNTYVMTNNVTVNSGVTLTIQPGVAVLAGTAVKLYVVGVLQANGNATSPITFAANGTAPRWGGIQFNASATGSVTWSTFDLADPSVAVVSSSPTVANNKVTRTGTAFRFVNSSGVDLLNNTVDRATLVGADLAGSSGLVQGNSFNNTLLGVQVRGPSSVILQNNVVTNASAAGASVGIYVDGLTSVSVRGNSVQRVRGPDGSAPSVQGGRGTDGTLAIGIFVNATGAVSLANNVVSDIRGGRGGDGQLNSLGNGGNGGNGGAAIGIVVLSAQTLTLQGDRVRNITGGRGGNGGASSVVLAGNGGNGGNGGGAVGTQAYNVPTSTGATGETALFVTGGSGGDGGAPSGSGHYGKGGFGADAYGIASAKALGAHLIGSVVQTILGGRGGNSTGTLLLSSSTYGGTGGQAVGLAVLGADGPVSNPTVLNSSAISGLMGGLGGLGYVAGGDGGNATGILVLGDGTPFNATSILVNIVSSLTGGNGGAGHGAGGNGASSLGIIAFHVTPTYHANAVSGLAGGNGGNATVSTPAGSGGQAAGIGAVQSPGGTSSGDAVHSVANGTAGIGKLPSPALSAGFYALGNATEPTALTVSNGTVSSVAGYDLYIDNDTHVTTVNTTFAWTKVHVEVDGNLTVRNFLTVQVLWPDNVTYLAGASIQVRDDSRLVWNLTSPGGPAQWLLVTDRVYYGANGFHDNSTNVSVTFPGVSFALDPRFVNMSTSHPERFVMRDVTAPVSAANTLPRYETARRFTITYMASDPDHGTGLKNVTLWYRTTGIDWTRFQTQATSGPGQFTFTASSDGPYAFVTIATDNASNVQPFPPTNNTWTIIDTIPPTSHVLALPQYENVLSFTVAWQASPGVTDVASYTVQANNGTGWTDWVTGTTATSGTYTATGQGPIAFRSIATDFAGNVEPKAGNDTWTMVDSIPPTILATSPTGSAANTTDAIVITFSEPMDTASAQAAFGLSPSATGSFSWAGGGTILTFQPSQPLQPGTTYTITVGTGATDLAGNALAQVVTFRFTTVAQPAGMSLSDLWPVLVAIAAVAAGLILFVVLRRRGQAADTVSEPPKPAPAPAAAKPEAAIDDVFLLYRRDGVLIKHETRRLRPDIDTDILSGMLTAVQQFVKDSFRGDEDEELNEMTVGQMHILIGRGKWLILAATITGGDVESMTTQIRKAVQDMEDHNWDRLEDWDGDMELAKALTPYLKKLIRGEYAT